MTDDEDIAKMITKKERNMAELKEETISLINLKTISLRENNSDILTRWKYECKNGFWTREIISQIKVTVEVLPLKGKSYDRDVCY